MLKPFQIRNLRVSTQSQPEQLADSRAPAGVVQISATDYDDLASNHPRARLTYMDDDDDDEIITVSSQRLVGSLSSNQNLTLFLRLDLLSSSLSASRSPSTLIHSSSLSNSLPVTSVRCTYLIFADQTL